MTHRSNGSAAKSQASEFDNKEHTGSQISPMAGRREGESDKPTDRHTEKEDSRKKTMNGQKR